MVTEQIVERESVVRTESPESAKRIRPLYRGTQIVWYIFGILEALLLIRFLLRALGANTGAGFTQFILGLTHIFVAPFTYVFPPAVVSGSVIEWSTLLALLVYWLVAYGITRLLIMGRPVSQTEAKARLMEKEDGVLDT
jgi:hypothetical protein